MNKKKKLDLANMWADTILILFISICTALLGEGKSIKCIDKFARRGERVYSDSTCIYVCRFNVRMRCSGLTWLMVYRTEKYQKLKAEVEKQSKKREFAEIASVPGQKQRLR